MPPKRAAYVIWVNGVTNPDQLAIAGRLAAFLGNGAIAVDLSVSTATSIPPDKRSQDRARNDALLEFVFAADRKYKAVVITGKLCRFPHSVPRRSGARRDDLRFADTAKTYSTTRHKADTPLKRSRLPQGWLTDLSYRST